MASFTVRVGLLLIVLGIASYVSTGGVSVTALIPAAFGLVLAVCGVVGTRSEGARRHAMHVAAGVALIGLLATASALLQLPSLVGSPGGDGRLGDVAARKPAMVARAGMALMLLVYLGYSVKSFVDARLRRKA